MTSRGLMAVVLVALVALAGPTAIARAQDEGPPPTELWEAYPLGDSTEPDPRPPGQPANPAPAERGDGDGDSVLAGAALLCLAAAALALLVARRRRRDRRREAREAQERALARAEQAHLKWLEQARETRAREREARARSARSEVVQAPVSPPRTVPRHDGARPEALGYTSFFSFEEFRQVDTRLVASQLRTACRRRGLRLVGLVGDLQTRPELQRPGLGVVLDRLERGEARALVVADLSRLSRSPDEVGALVSWLRERDIRLVVIDGGLDTDTEEGRERAGTGRS